VGAAAIPALVEQLVAARKAECMIVIPGGMAEKKGGEVLQDRVAAVLESSRREDWRGPLICGPNSMGVLSIPGGYDTTFIPETKFPKPEAAIRNVAYISQSGAFMLSRISNVPEIAPRYMISAGNQMDLTISDYVSYLKDDPEVHVLAVYVEGFQQLDGLTFLREARQAIDNGKIVVLYKGGRSAEGQGAAAGHTASIAGDYRVSRALARGAGLLVADTHREFEAYVRLSCLLRDKRIRGGRVALMSNAGFQTVAMADNLHQSGRTLSLAMPAPATLVRLKALLSPSGIDALINIGNPLDITPSAGDKLFCECVRCLLEDDGVDAMIAGVVPFAPAMSTLESSPNPAELITHPDSMAYRLPELAAETSKPLMAVIEGGRTYDALVHVLQIEGLPVFRIADEGIRALGSYLAFRLQPRRA
jgi:acyl-CoA synthetase (NDP forming)